MAKLKKFGSFPVKGSDGKSYTLDVFDEVIDVSTMADEPSGAEEFGGRINLIGGMPVNRKAKDEYASTDGMVTYKILGPNTP